MSTNPDKDEVRNPWHTLKIDRPFISRRFAIRSDEVVIHTGRAITYTYIEHPGAVYVVPAIGGGEVALLRQYRYPVQDWCWEVPAGGIEGDEDGMAAAVRELAEELGGVSQNIRPIATFYASKGISSERSQVFLAKDVILGANAPEPTELLRVMKLPIREALRMAHHGEISDGQSALALLLCETYLLE